MSRRVLWPALALGTLAACRTPTEIEVTVTTDVPCARVTGTTFTAGELGTIEVQAPTTTSTTCSNGRVGAVVLLPSGDDSARVGFRLVTGIDGQQAENCSADAGYGPKCIVARRSLRYIPHTQLEVPVDMRGVCAGNDCGDPTMTCVQGACVPATIADPTQCQGAGCGETVLLGGDGGAPAAPGDGGVDATLGDASPEAATPGLDGQAPGPDGQSPSDASGDGPAAVDSGPPVFTIAGCVMGGLQAGAAWPMEGYCPGHRNRSPYVGPTTAPTPKWIYPPTGSLVGLLHAAPSIGADGTLYVTTDATRIDAIHPDGTLAWEVQAAPSDGGFEGMAVIAADHTLRLIDYGSGDYVTVGLDGGGLARKSLVFGGTGPATIRGGLTLDPSMNGYAGDNDGTLWALDSHGAARWLAGGAILDPSWPTLGSSGSIYTIGADSISLASLHPDGGSAWTTKLDAGALSSPVIAPDGTLRTVSYDGDRIYSYDPGTGAQRWSYSFNQGSGDNLNSLAIGDDGTTYVGTQQGMAAVDGTGQLSWLDTTISPCQSPVIDAAGRLYAWCDNNVAMFDPHATPRWQWSVPIPAAGSVAYLQVLDSIVIGPGGQLYMAVDENLQTGNVRAEIVAALGD